MACSKTKVILIFSEFHACSSRHFLRLFEQEVNWINYVNYKKRIWAEKYKEIRKSGKLFDKIIIGKKLMSE